MARVAILAIFLSLACREAPSTAIVVLPRATSLTPDEARRIAGVGYSPTDLALGWRGEDSLVVGHIESYAYADIRTSTCAGTGVFEVPFRNGGAARTVRAGAPVCDALRDDAAVALLPDASALVHSETVPTNRSRLEVLNLKDATTRTLSGACEPYAEEPAVSPDGSMVAMKAVCGRRDQAEWGVYVGTIRGEGWRRVAGGDSVSAVMPAWSPDGRALAVRLGDATDPVQARRIAVVDVATGELRPLVAGSWPSWSPNAEWIAFIHTDSASNDDDEIRLIRPDGSDARTLFRNQTRTTYVRAFGPMREGAVRAPLLWTRDSRGVVFGRAFDKGTSLWHITIGEAAPRQLTDAAQP